MSILTTGWSRKGSFRGGVHPVGRKQLAADSPIDVIPTPSEVVIALMQHIGAACEAVVAPRTKVAIGQMIGKSGGFVSAPVHASIAGTTAAESAATLPNGQHVPVIPIKAGDQPITGQSIWDDIFGGEWPTKNLKPHDPAQIVQAVHDAGIVGQGGAAFPTHVKLTRNKARPIDVVLINGCECEPYLTADYRLMIQAPLPIVCGALLSAQAAGAQRVIVAIEDNKLMAVEIVRRAARGTDVEVVALPTKYPMGGERQTVRATLNRIVPTGGLPLDVGVVVLNVATAAAVARAVLRARPLTHRVVAVSGAGIAHPRNLLVPIGISYAALVDYCGGLRPQAARVVAGGPMMGFALGDLNSPVTKGTSGVTVLTEDDVRQPAETNCVRCGRCADVCPLRLVPTRIALACRQQDWEQAKRYYIDACMECGCCGYVCPAGIPLVQLIRMGKAQMPGSQATGN